METFDAIRTVLAVRSYTDEPIPETALLKILEAGRLTGSASNKQPWHFVVVQDPDTLTQIAEALPRHGPYIAGAPLAIAVVIEPTNLALSDGSRAVQSMVLTAWAEGIGSNWVGFPGLSDAAKPILGIPEDHDLLAIVPFGYPTDPGGKGRKTRRPLEEVASRERWSAPFTPE